MWSFEPASPETSAALEFLKSYGAPEPKLIQHPKPVVEVLSFEAWDVNNVQLLELYDMQEKYTQDAVVNYNGAVHNWLLNVARQPELPLPPTPKLPSLIPPLVELLFGTCGIDAPLVVACPPLALRLLRQAQVAPGDPGEYTPFPRPEAHPVDLRVIGDECPGTPGYFRPGPADHFPDHYIYTLDGQSYVKFSSMFGAVWMRLGN